VAVPRKRVAGERVVHPRTQQGIDRRAAIVEFVRAYWAEHGIPPSTPEITVGVGLKSHAGVLEHIHRLVDEGVLLMAPGVARSIRLAPKKKQKKKAS
jgi:SOS-response transcriptional repressor LexA